MYFKLKEYKLDDSAAIMVLFTDAQVFFRAADLQRMFAVTTISRPLSQCSGEIYSFTQLREKFSKNPRAYSALVAPLSIFLTPAGVDRFISYGRTAQKNVLAAEWIRGRLFDEVRTDLDKTPLVPGILPEETARTGVKTTGLAGVQSEIAALRTDMEASQDALRTDMEALRAELGKTKDALRTLAQLVAPVLEKHS